MISITMNNSVSRSTIATRISILALLISGTFSVEASDLYFMADALENTNEVAGKIDLTRFERGEQLPGVYRVSIWLNNEYVSSENINFTSKDDGSLSPEISYEFLESLGVKMRSLPHLTSGKNTITNIEQFITAAKASLDFDKQRLDISIPQSELQTRARGMVDAKKWDQGIPALLLNYSFNGSRNWSRQGETLDQLYLNLQSGFNLGAWRLRNYSTATKNNETEKFSSLNTTLSRDVQALKGQLQIGETSTPGDIFDSIMFRGVQLYSDDTMLPESMRGFAPIIRGIARTNATVTIKQNGYTVYQTYVAPGSFEIRDLYPTSTSGDLDVTVTEADGGIQHFVQPFSAVPIMLREGRIKYAISGGEYRTTKTDSETPNFAMGTLSYGVSNNLTLYGGMISANNYLSGVLGSGVSFGEIGSLSADVTVADSKLTYDGKSNRRGQSYRLQYSKTVATTDTTVTLASYRYSTEGFYTFQEVNEADGNRYNKRSRLQLNLNQSLLDWGNFYITAYQQDYWRQNGYERSISTGYNTSINGIAYSFGYTYSETPSTKKKDQILAFSVQVPLNRLLPDSWASYSVNSQKNGPVTQQVGLSGTALDNNNLSYSLQQGYTSSGGDARSTLNTTYKGGYGTVSAGYNYGKDNSQFNFGLQGGVIAHEDGVTFSQPLGDTVALLKAEGASGARIRNNTGVKTDWRGYAVVPYTSAYQENRISIDTSTLGPDVDITQSVVNVVPTRGAVVRATFNAQTGYRALITLIYANKPVPFGAVVKIAGKNNMGIVGDNGEVYMSGLNDNDKITVQLGQKSCSSLINLKATSGVIHQLTAICK